MLLALLSGALYATATVHETVTYTNVDSDGEYGDPVNEIRTFNATGLTAGNVPYSLGALQLYGTISSVQGADFALEGLIEVTHPNSMMAVVQMFPGEFTFGILTGSASLVLAPGSSAAGTWSFRFFEDYDDGGNGFVDKIWNSLQIDFTDELPDAPPSTDLGMICNPGANTTFSIGPAEVVWFRVEVPESTGNNDRYLDIDTEGSSPLDTEIGIYTDQGILVANDDDDGTGFMSQLSFGTDAAVRSGPGGDAEDYDGRDGDVGAGTYYVAVGQYDTTFGGSYQVASDGGESGTVHLNFYTNMVCATVNGVVNLQDIDGDAEGCEVTFEVREVGGFTPLEVHTVTLGPGGTYSFATSQPDGSYDVTAKGTHWLRQLNGGVAFIGGASNVDFDLINGDADPDNEVNLVDAGALSAAFGSIEGDPNWNANADLNKDGEVNLVDWGILSARFGLAGDE